MTAGIRIEATIYGDCVVVLTPQTNMDRYSRTDRARQLIDDGCLALAIDENEAWNEWLS